MLLISGRCPCYTAGSPFCCRSLVRAIREETRYGLRVNLNIPYDQAFERITGALQK